MSASSADTATPTAAPLDEVMLAMDVVDTLRHRQDLVTRELDETKREANLIEKLRDIYRHQGIEVPDHILREGVAALAESRFVYEPPKPGFKTALAKLYVSRGGWGKPVLATVLAVFILLGGYFAAYAPWRAAQAEQARIELTESLPAEMDALYRTIFEETKVQQASIEAEELVKRGKSAAAEGNRAAATKAVADLTALRDQLRQEYALRVVNRPDVKSGFWTFPEINTEATNYYLVVEGLDADGNALSLPILNEENGQTETVKMWGLRVPETVYNSVAADKQDDGIIQRNVVGRKQYGFLDLDYVVPVLGGAVTKW
jgi:hypothetical protein